MKQSFSQCKLYVKNLSAADVLWIILLNYIALKAALSITKEIKNSCPYVCMKCSLFCSYFIIHHETGLIVLWFYTKTRLKLVRLLCVFAYPVSCLVYLCKSCQQIFWGVFREEAALSWVSL